VDDRADNQSAWDAIQKVKSEGLVNWTAVIETIDARDYEANTRVFAEAGYDVVVTVGDNAEAATYSIAGLFPKVYFLGADQRPSVDRVTLPNLVWLVFREDQMGFLAGALAASFTQTGKVGAVYASDGLPAMKQYGDGYLNGAQYINPEVKATVSYHNDVDLGASLNDPGWGETAASSLIDEGVDVIFSAGGTTANGALESTASRGAYGIGAEIDQYFILPEAASHMLSSVLKLVGSGVSDLVSAAKEASENQGPFRSGIYYGQVDFAPYHDLVSLIPEEVKHQIADLPQALLYGEIRPDEVVPFP
jgi:basic membrane protein A